MPTSQNGYSANDRSVIRSVTIPGTDVRVAVRVGPAGDLLIAAAERWHREVEPLRAPDGVLDCWGYAERNIRGSATELSNHASGTALDFRARAHPLGTDPRANFTDGQIAAIRRIVGDSRGALRWGGDYSGRKDGMHIEINASPAACVVALPLVRLEEDDMFTNDDRKLLEAAAKGNDLAWVRDQLAEAVGYPRDRDPRGATPESLAEREVARRVDVGYALNQILDRLDQIEKRLPPLPDSSTPTQDPTGGSTT